MDAVIKIGGSLAANEMVLRVLCLELSNIAEQHKLLIVPGGGEFADTVRSVASRFSVNSWVSHRMALLGMDQYGLLLSNLIPKCRLAYSLSVLEGLSGSGHAAALLPSRLVFRARSLKASWDLTSDSVAAYVAARLNANKLILVTDVDGIFTANPKLNGNAELLDEVSASGLLELDTRTSVDRFLPNLLLKFGLTCYVVNGNFPERLNQIIDDKPSTCTRITPK